MYLNPKQLAAVLAGLHLLEEKLADPDFEISDLHLMVLTDDGEHDPITIQETIELREQINFGNEIP